jgi:hypothetical protein
MKRLTVVIFILLTHVGAAQTSDIADQSAVTVVQAVEAIKARVFCSAKLEYVSQSSFFYGYDEWVTLHRRDALDRQYDVLLAAAQQRDDITDAHPQLASDMDDFKKDVVDVQLPSHSEEQSDEEYGLCNQLADLVLVEQGQAAGPVDTEEYNLQKADYEKEQEKLKQQKIFYDAKQLTACHGYIVSLDGVDAKPELSAFFAAAYLDILGQLEEKYEMDRALYEPELANHYTQSKKRDPAIFGDATMAQMIASCSNMREVLERPQKTALLKQDIENTGVCLRAVHWSESNVGLDGGEKTEQWRKVWQDLKVYTADNDFDINADEIWNQVSDYVDREGYKEKLSKEQLLKKCDDQLKVKQAENPS